MTDSRFIGVAVGGSFAIHLAGCVLAILLLAGKDLLTTRAPESEPFSPPSPPEEEMMMLTPDMIIVEQKAESATKPKQGREDFVDATGMREAATADPSARLEADRNTVAGSEADASPDPNGSGDLPWQKGENIASVHIVVSAPSAGAPVTGDGDVVIPTPDASGAQAGTAADETLRNAMKGAAPKREEVAVAAVETPRARYQTAVNKALTASKNKIVERLVLPVGSATVHFFVDREGRASDARFIGRPTDSRIGDAALSAVLEANLPPIPVELFEDLPDRRMPFTLEFFSYR
jgi:hypothetical protein